MVTTVTLTTTDDTIPNSAEKVLYVSQYGSNSNPGTSPGLAFLTVTAAFSALGSAPGVINIGTGTYPFSATLGRNSGQRIVGAGTTATILSYTGTGTAIGHYSPGSGTRIYNAGLAGFLLTTSTGTIGVDLDSTSTSACHEVGVTGFSSKAWRLTSATSGGCVYNRFYGCLGSAPIGWSVEGVGSNSNNWYGCRANACSTVGLDITDSNQNVWNGGTIEGCATAFRVTAFAPSVSDGNTIRDTRLEGNATNWNVTGINIRDTVIADVLEVTATGTGIDSGTRSQINTSRSGSKRISTVGAVASWLFSRVGTNAVDVPVLHVQDTGNGGGNFDSPTVQVSTARATSSFIRGVRNGLTYFNVDAAGNLALPQGGSITIAGAQVGASPLGAWRPGDNGLMGASDHIHRVTVTSPALTSGVAALVKIKMDNTGALNTIVAFVQTASSTLTAGQCFAAVYTSAGVLLGVTADQSVAWATFGNKQMALTAPSVSVNAGDEVFVLLLSNGTSNPAFRGIPTPGSGMANYGQTAGGTPGLAYATYGAGLTAAPGSLVMASAVGTVTLFPWVGVK